MTNIEYLDIPDKSENDKKKYRSLRLPNGLTALIVSADVSSSNDDLKIKRSACSLAVKVGALAEPKKYHGLAHLLEHILYMGSENFPEENAFDKHLTQCGGHSNASTSYDVTNYYFSVIDQHLESVLAIFSDCVRSPLLRKETMARERNAVESEFQLRKTSDEVRRIQLLANLANPNYPHHHVFLEGNLRTLKDNISDDDELHKALVEFYRRYYTADQMIVCIQSQFPLDKLEELIIKFFGCIPHGEKMTPENSSTLYSYREAFDEEVFCKKVYFIKSEQNQRKLQITWSLPDLKKFYRCQPDNFVSVLLTRDIEGSLNFYLRRKHWALNIFTPYTIYESVTFLKLLTLTIHLTDEGFANLDEVLAAVFAYIKLLSKCETLKENYEEYQKLRAINFRFATESSEILNVNELIQCMTRFPMKDVITGNHIYSEYNEEQIKDVIGHLNEFKFNIMITSTKMHPLIDKFDLKEKWFETEYTMISMPETWQHLWEQSTPMENLFLPLPNNKFAPMDFRILWIENGRQQLPKFVQKIFDTDLGQMWFRQDDKFLEPRCYMRFYFISPLTQENAKNNVLTTLLAELIAFYATQELYWAVISGMQWSIFMHSKGIIVEVNSYSDKFHVFVEKIVELFVSIEHLVTEGVLNVCKEDVHKSYYNNLIRHENLFEYIYDAIIQKENVPVVERYKAVPHITLSDVQDFSKQFREHLYVRALIQGNLVEQSALDMMNSIIGSLKFKKIPETHRKFIESQISKIPKGTNTIRVRNLRRADPNSIVCNYYQMGQMSLRDRCILGLLLALIKEPLFDTLRTKEQLSYNVDANVKLNFGVSGYEIKIFSQENKFEAKYVEKRIDAFRQQAIEFIEKMPDKTFEQSRESFIKSHQIYPKTLRTEFKENLNHIAHEEFIFDIRDQRIEMLKTISKSEVVQFWRNHDGENMRKLSIQIIGSVTSAASVGPTASTQSTKEIEMNPEHINIEFLPTNDSSMSISNIEDFKSKIEFYPLDKQRSFFK